ncbi:unnamed protein product [Moneuplotes crassus]|uniref:Uncharacterized protein n=1 Tax=Euplotes crassus TaxID=5936 RepID=A0AAD1Y851_EUPCR|nr:unnamed protein product [Moneuplotes crassus]
MIRSPTTRAQFKRHSSSHLLTVKNNLSSGPQNKDKRQRDLSKLAPLLPTKRSPKNKTGPKRKNLFKRMGDTRTKQNDESPIQKRRRLGMIGDMRNFNLVPSAVMKNKLSYYYTAYNNKNLKTYYMTFDENEHNFTEEDVKIDDDSNFDCWRLIADFILKAEQKQFNKVISKFRNREIHEMKNNIKKAQRVFKKIVTKNRKFGRLFKKIIKHTYSQVGISEKKEISDEMRHKVSEIIKNSLDLKIQEIKVRFNNHKRLMALRRRTRRNRSLRNESKSNTSQDIDSVKPFAILEPLLENEELPDFPLLKQLDQSGTESQKEDSKYNIKVSEDSFSSSSSVSSLEKSDTPTSTSKDLLSKLIDRRKPASNKKSKFLKKQHTMMGGPRRMFKAACLNNSRNTKDSKDFDAIENSKITVNKEDDQEAQNKDQHIPHKIALGGLKTTSSFLLPPDPNQFHYKMLNLPSDQLTPKTSPRVEKDSVESPSKISKYNICNYYLKGSKHSVPQRILSEPRLSKLHEYNRTRIGLSKDQFCSEKHVFQGSFEDSLRLSFSSKDCLESSKSKYAIPEMPFLNKSYSESRIKWNAKVSKIISKRVRNRSKLVNSQQKLNLNKGSIKSVLKKISRVRKSTKTKLSDLYRLNSPKIVGNFQK